MAEAAVRPWRRALLRWAGVAILALCLAFLVRALAGLDFARLVAAMGWREWLATGACAIAYGASLGLLANAWAAVAAAGRKLPLASVLAVYGPGAVAKYLPGSVFHYASRQVIGRREDLEHRAMAKASVVEAAIHVGIALTVSGGLLVGGAWVLAAGLGLGAALLLVRSRPLVTAIASQLLFFSIFGAIVVLLASFGAMIDDPARLAGWFFAAWTVGFLVPLAPGGIGVREAALIALAAHHESTDAIALVALLARLVGIVGDGLFGLAGYFAGNRLYRHASA